MCGAAAGLSPVANSGSLSVQRACVGSQGRLRAARTDRLPAIGLPGSIPAAMPHAQSPLSMRMLSPIQPSLPTQICAIINWKINAPQPPN